MGTSGHPATSVPTTATAAGAAVVAAGQAVVGAAAALGLGGAAAVAAAPPAAVKRTNPQKLVQVWGKSMSSVTIKPYDQLSEPLKSFPLGAWTMSGNEIYLRDLSKSGYNDNFYYAVLYHEGWHIMQFRKHGRPTLYETMIKYEIEAYGKSAKWLAANWKKYAIDAADKKETFTTWQRYAVGFIAKRTAVLAANPQDAEAVYKDFLLGNNTLDRDKNNSPRPAQFLPPHKALSDLYP